MTDEGKERLRIHEGLRLRAYRCPAGVWTIGYGHTGGIRPGMKITREEADRLFDADIEQAERDARALVPGLDEMSSRRRDALVNMAFNLGRKRLAKFTTSLNYIRLGRYEQAANALERTLWYRQVKGRAQEIVAAIREG